MATREHSLRVLCVVEASRQDRSPGDDVSRRDEHVAVKIHRCRGDVKDVVPSLLIVTKVRWRETTGLTGVIRRSLTSVICRVPWS